MGEEKKKMYVLEFWIAIASSLFLFISGTTGVSSWMEIENVILKYINLESIKLLFVLLLIIASAGAISVMIGGILLLREKVFLGNLFISLGSGAGVLSIIFNIFILVNTPGLSIYSFLSFSSLGTILALLAQILSRIPRKKARA